MCVRELSAGGLLLLPLPLTQQQWLMGGLGGRKKIVCNCVVGKYAYNVCLKTCFCLSKAEVRYAVLVVYGNSKVLMRPTMQLRNQITNQLIYQKNSIPAFSHQQVFDLSH